MIKLGTPFNRFSDQYKLIVELAKEDSKAIQYILKKVEGSCLQFIKKMGLTSDCLEDVMHDGLILFIRKIQEGSYDASLSAPQTYLTGICKNLFLNITRAKRAVSTIELEEAFHTYSEDVQASFYLKENLKLVNKILGEIGSPCKELIQLKYLDGYQDEEQINLKLVNYSSVDSLRVSRSQCMKKLSAVSLKYKSDYEN